MTTRITLWLLLMVAGVQALADGLFTVSRRANNALAGTTFDVALFDDTPVSDSAAERAYNKSLDFVRAEKRAFAFFIQKMLNATCVGLNLQRACPRPSQGLGKQDMIKQNMFATCRIERVFELRCPPQCVWLIKKGMV